MDYSILIAAYLTGWLWAIGQQAANTSWGFDLVSFAIGVISALVTVGLLFRNRTRINQFWLGLKQRASQFRQRLTANMATRYSEAAVDTARAMHLFGSMAPLDEIYVEPQLRAVLAPSIDGSAPLLSPAQSIKASDHVVILGPPGSGRTVLFSHLLLSNASRLNKAGEDIRVPLYVYLPILALEIAGASENETPDDTAPDAAQHLVQTAVGSLSRVVASGVARWLRRQVEAGNTLVLLDGWDEVDAASRSAVTSWIQGFAAAHPGNHVLISAGQRGYGPLISAGYVPVRLVPWSIQKLTELQRHWIEAWPRKNNGTDKDLPTIRYSLEPPTPLEATLDTVIRLRGQVPARTPAGRMAQIMDLLLPHPEPDDKGTVAWPLETGHDALGSLALSTVELGRYSIVRQEIQSAVTAAMPAPLHALEQGSEDEETREPAADREEQDRRTLQIVDCCRAITATGAPIRSWDNQCYFFAHPLVAAFLAARHLATEDVPVQAKPDDPNWLELLRYYVGLAPAEPIIEQLLARPDDLFLNNLWASAALMAASPQSDDAWRAALIKRYAQLFLNPRLPEPLRKRCLESLVKSGDRNVTLLFRRETDNSHAAIRASAILGLGAMGAEDDLASIDLALGDGDPQVRLAAINALTILARWDNKDALELVVAAMIESEDKVQRIAVEALAEMGKEGQEILREAAHDQDLIVRRAAAYGLASIGEPWARETLAEMQSKDDEWLVRNAAAEALEFLALREASKPPDMDLGLPKPESEPWLITWAADRGEGTGVGEAALNTLMRALTQGEPVTRLNAIDTLRRIADPRTTEPLRRSLREREPYLREAALEALDEISRRHNLTIMMS
jgi:HEAT repeat protein